MSGESIFEEYAQQAGWSAAVRAEILLRYIQDQQDEAGFEDFLRRQVVEEDELGASYEAR